MDRTAVRTPARRAEHLAAVNAARAAAVKADIQTELEGLLQYHGYTEVVIATTSPIGKGDENPAVVVTLTGDTFKTGIAPTDLVVDVGTTSLTLNTVTYDTSTQITISFTGTATEGTLAIQVKASGLVSTPYLISNIITIEVPAAG